MQNLDEGLPEYAYEPIFIGIKTKNILLIAGTGDDADNNNDGGGDPNYLLHKNPVRPALYAANKDLAGYILAVGAVDENLKITDTSNICGSAKDNCLVAPGYNVFGAMSDENQYAISAGDSANKYAALSGTSQASAFVTGAAAILRGAWPNLTAPQISNILLKTATDLGEAGVDEIYGHGLLNLYAAVQAYGTNTVPAGATSLSAGYDIRASQLTTNPIFGDAFATNVANSLQNTVFFDDFGRDYKANIASKISAPSASTSIVNNLNSIIVNNYKTNVIPLSFNSKMLFAKSSFSSQKTLSDDGQITAIKFQTKSYSDSRFKHLILDNSQEDKALTIGNGFAFSQELNKNSAATFSFNIDEIKNSNFAKANEFNFLATNSLAANPFQSFMTGSSAAQSGFASGNGNSNGNSNGNNSNLAAQKNFNQIILSQKFLDNKFKINLSNQTSYNNSSIIAKNSSKENQISDLNFAYNPNEKTNVALSFGKLNEFNNNFLNSKALGVFGNSNNVDTNYVKISAMQKLFDSNFSIIASFSEGQTNASGDSSGIFRSYSSIKSRSSSLGLISENFLNGKFGISYSEPLRVYKGSVNIDIPTGQDANGNVLRYRGNVSLKPQGKERNLELFYATVLNKKSGAHLGLNFLATKDAGNVKGQGSAYLGVVSFGVGF